MTRYVIARQERGEFLAGPAVPVLDLPDAEHIHLHRRPDGTWHAVAMAPLNAHDADTGLLLWVDVPADPEGRAEWFGEPRQMTPARSAVVVCRRGRAKSASTSVGRIWANSVCTPSLMRRNTPLCT